MKTGNIILILIVVILIISLFSMKPKIETETGGETNDITKGVRNKNPGNIKLKDSNDWLGKIPRNENTDGIFEQFKEFKYGTRAHLKLLRNIYRNYGKDTVSKIVTHYHPPIDIQLGINQASALIRYINFVADKMNVRNDQRINLNDDNTLLKMGYWMGKFENNGSDKITLDMYKDGLSMI